MKRHALLAAMLVGAANAAAQTAPPAKAAACTTCHGPLGLSTAPDAPHLAGQPEIYLTAQLRAYRSGARPHPVMNVIAKSLSDDDIAVLAAWYAGLKIEVKSP
jgi:cytochrome c553